MRYFNSWITIAVGLLIMTCLVQADASATDQHDDPFYLTEKIVTPHVVWGKPYAGGKIKVLLLCDFRGARQVVELAQRFDLDWDTVTACYRGDFQWMPYAMSGKAGRKFTNKKLREKLQDKYDCLIVSGFQPGAWDSDILDMIEAKVKAGMGLVWIAPWGTPPGLDALLPAYEKEAGQLNQDILGLLKRNGDSYLTDLVPLEMLPPVFAFSTIQVQRGQTLAKLVSGDREIPTVVAYDPPTTGRTVVLNYAAGYQDRGKGSGFIPNVRQRVADLGPVWPWWEQFYSLLGKSIVWASQREPAVRIQFISPRSQTWTDNKTAAPRELSVGIVNPNAATRGQLWIEIVGEMGQKIAQINRDVNIPTGPSAVAVDLPSNMVDGLHIVHVVLRQDATVLDWGSAAVRMDLALKMSLPREQWKDLRSYTDGQTARFPVHITVRGSGEPHKLKLSGQLVDHLGRVLYRVDQSLTLASSTIVPLSIPITDPIAQGATLRLTLSEGDRVWAYAQRPVMLAPPRTASRAWDEYEHIAWGSFHLYDQPHLVHAKADQMRRQGVTACVGYNWESDLTYREGFRLIEQGGLNIAPSHRGSDRDNYKLTSDTKYLRHDPSLEDPENIKKQHEWMASVARAFRPFRPLGYCHGDEQSYDYWTDYDFAPVSLRSFRTWLQKTQYKSLHELNAEWDTRFETWDQVMPMPLDQARKHTSLAPWADHRSYNDTMTARAYAAANDAFRQGDPQAIGGISGTPAAYPYGGVDWWKYGQHQSYQFMLHYTHHGMEELHRSVMPGVPKARWNGYGADDSWFRPTMWWWLFNGDTGLSNFMLRGMLKPDFAPTDNQETMRELMLTMQQGVGKLIMQVRGNLHNDMAIHLSQPSIQAAQALDQWSRFADNRESWLDLIRSSGYTFAWCAGAQVEQGLLLKQKEYAEFLPSSLDVIDLGYAALFLPMSIAISDAEADQLAQYVKAGGILIADPLVGLMDQHCKLRNSETIEQLFGIHRDQPGWQYPKQSVQGYLPRIGKNGLSQNKRYDGFFYDPKFTVTEGVVRSQMDGVPVVVTRRWGKGLAVIVNIGFNDYLKLKKEQKHGSYLAWVANLLKVVGATRETRTASRRGGPPDVSVFNFSNGQQQLIGLVDVRWDRPAPAKNVRIQLGHRAHAYEVESGQYLGMTDRLHARLPLGGHALWMLSPQRMEKLVVTGPKVVRQGETAAFSFTLFPAQPDTKSILRFEVTAPDGTKVEWYAGNVVANNGVATNMFRTALNDPPGTWTASVRDVASHMTAQTTFQLVTPAIRTPIDE